MPFLKKLSFAPLYLISFAFFTYQLNNLLSIPNLVFSLDLAVLQELVIFVIFALLTSIIFVIFCSLAQDWKLVLPVILLSSLIPFIFLPSPASLALALGNFFFSIIIYSLVFQKINNYITWQPTSLFSSLIKQMAFLLIVLSAFCFYIVSDFNIKQNGFEIPDSLIESALKFTPQLLEFPTQTNVKGIKIAQNPSLTQEQIELLKNNPELLKRYGVDPNALDSISPAPSGTSSATLKSNSSLPSLGNLSLNPEALDLKKLVKNQVQTMINPYISFIPIVLSVLFFFTLSFIHSILAILISPLLWLTFLTLEKTGFITFTTEQRTVKKIVV